MQDPQGCNQTAATQCSEATTVWTMCRRQPRALPQYAETIMDGYSLVARRAYLCILSSKLLSIPTVYTCWTIVTVYVIKWGVYVSYLKKTNDC